MSPSQFFSRLISNQTSQGLRGWNPSTCSGDNAVISCTQGVQSKGGRSGSTSKVLCEEIRSRTRCCQADEGKKVHTSINVPSSRENSPVFIYILSKDPQALIRREQARAAFYRQYKISADDIGKLELALLHVSTANAIPTLFWLITFIASDPALVASLREELPSVITVSESKDGKREAHVDITKFDPHCPLLVSCYREVVRLVNSQLGTRRVMADTTISDGKSTYLLRKGWDVNMPSGVSHLSTGSWGPNAASFDARRFMKLDAKGTMSEKAKEEKRAYIPFGGGKHLCPGRNFAFAEILGFVAALLMGFDVKAKDGGLIEVPEIRRAKLGEAVSKPFGKGLAMGANITRRQGWEDVVWQFTT